MQSVKEWLGLKNGNGSARDVLEELIEEREEAEVPIDDDERALLVNILELRGRTVRDVMVPRADIVTLDDEASLKDVIDLVTSKGHSRLPIYRDTLDGAIGMVHIKDVMAWRGSDTDFQLASIVRPVLFMPPSMRVLELLLEMRIKRCHMALVVDEYGGVDGLVTIEDLVEEIVGEIEDEHDRSVEPMILENNDGTLIADARVTIESLEDRLGAFVNAEEREDIDTLGGLVFSLAGRVPALGELIAHPSGLEFEVEDADPRRIKRLRLRRIDAITLPTDSGK
ncbi:MAG: HlyC/CorC family transporter [Rhodospirillaceae bacterium]|nr:HlyC/CorC family transporter [Rhodospirillaceae bacterium]MBT4218848.1 HlyC/CorC family transporter [Rhodospirillaceae bacterium]MBT5012947.1 HlyC/CorC family transporter [Rhodospirillaceae bacterium]MBT5308495.1 HlyC/CorC family transporter [Rhodospirillaceae bacterium]MBT6406316.1 HlyC/CorC family transporter [Rhodospirillaceae bacterium]